MLLVIDNRAGRLVIENIIYRPGRSITGRSQCSFFVVKMEVSAIPFRQRHSFFGPMRMSKQNRVGFYRLNPILRTVDYNLSTTQFRTFDEVSKPI